MDDLEHETAEKPRLSDLVTADALAVASLCFALTSLLASGLVQFLVFVVSEGRDATWQFVSSALPVLAFALGAVFAARAAWQRGVSHPAYRSLAGAGLLLGGVIAVLTAVGIVVALVGGDVRV